MFTGIIERVGTVARVEPLGRAARLTLDGGTLTAECHPGDSVAVNGVCLTATGVDRNFTVVAVEETLRRTTLGRLKTGSRVNLELPLRPTDRLGGHFVQGHVDGRATVVELTAEAESAVATFHLECALCGYLVEKGSVAVDGVSLTVAGLGPDSFRVALIPQTRSVTTLGDLRVGDEVNVEVDILAKYVERLLSRAEKPTRITEQWLRQLGY